jgi:hypothetical protein
VHRSNCVLRKNDQNKIKEKIKGFIECLPGRYIATVQFCMERACIHIFNGAQQQNKFSLEILAISILILQLKPAYDYVLLKEAFQQLRVHAV